MKSDENGIAISRKSGQSGCAVAAIDVFFPNISMHENMRALQRQVCCSSYHSYFHFSLRY
jgi:hypothetical protein